MPYKLRKAPKRDLYWVIGPDGKHHSKDPLPKERAEAQMRALYAAESKEMKGGATHREEYLKKKNLEDKSYSIAELSKISSVPESILQQVYNRGVGAHKTSGKSVRLKDSYVKNVDAPMSKKLSKEQWGMARVYSFLNGNPAHDEDLRTNKKGGRPPATPLEKAVVVLTPRQQAYNLSQAINAALNDPFEPPPADAEEMAEVMGHLERANKFIEKSNPIVRRGIRYYRKDIEGVPSEAPPQARYPPSTKPKKPSPLGKGISFSKARVAPAPPEEKKEEKEEDLPAAYREGNKPAMKPMGKEGHLTETPGAKVRNVQALLGNLDIWDELSRKEKYDLFKEVQHFMYMLRAPMYDKAHDLLTKVATTNAKADWDAFREEMNRMGAEHKRRGTGRKGKGIFSSRPVQPPADEGDDDDEERRARTRTNLEETGELEEEEEEEPSLTREQRISGLMDQMKESSDDELIFNFVKNDKILEARKAEAEGKDSDPIGRVDSDPAVDVDWDELVLLQTAIYNVLVNRGYTEAMMVQRANEVWRANVGRMGYGKGKKKVHFRGGRHEERIAQLKHQLKLLDQVISPDNWGEYKALADAARIAEHDLRHLRGLTAEERRGIEEYKKDLYKRKKELDSFFAEQHDKRKAIMVELKSLMADQGVEGNPIAGYSEGAPPAPPPSRSKTPDPTGYGRSGGDMPDLIGEGIFDTIKEYGKKAYKAAENTVIQLGEKARNVIKPTRMNYQPKVRSFLTEYGEQPIYQLTVVRAPIQSWINTAFNAITFGKWDEVKRRYGYDKFFHLGLHASFTDKRGMARSAVIEKLEVINIDTGYTTQRDAEYMFVPMSGPISFNTLLNKTEQLMMSNFYTYDAFNNNCQVFITSILKANGLLNDQLNAFINQPVGELLGELPSYTQPVARAITDIGAKANELVMGQGKLRGGAPTEEELYNKYIQEGKPENTARYMAKRNAPIKAQQEQVEANLKAQWTAETSGTVPYDQWLKQRRLAVARQRQQEKSAQYAAEKKQEEEGWQAREEKKKEWNRIMRARAESPLGKFVEGLVKVGDVAVDLGSKVGVPPIVAEAYKTFAPPGSKYYQEGTIAEKAAKRIGLGKKKGLGVSEQFKKHRARIAQEAQKEGAMSQEQLAEYRKQKGAEHQAHVNQIVAQNEEKERRRAEYEAAKERERKILAGLTSVADVAADVAAAIGPLPLKAAAEAYKTFAPPGSKYHHEGSVGDKIIHRVKSRIGLGAPPRSFKAQLRAAGLTPQQYLERVKAKAKAAGYDPATLDFNDKGPQKLVIKDEKGRSHKFGRIGYGDFILWSEIEKRGKAEKGHAEQKRQTFRASHSAIKGNWKKNKFSPNKLAIEILW